MTRFLAAGLWLLTLGAVLAPVAAWIIVSEFSRHWEAIHSGRQLIIISSTHGYLPGGLLVALGLFIYGISVLGLIILRKDYERLIPRLQKSLAPLFIVGIVTTFLGHLAVLNWWENRASTAGYEECPPMTLLLNHITYTAWVKDQALCHDQDVKEIVQNGHPDESHRVESRLQARARLEAARDLRVEQPSRAKTARREQMKQDTRAY